MTEIDQNQGGTTKNSSEMQFQKRLKPVLEESFNRDAYSIKEGVPLRYRIGDIHYTFKTDLTIFKGEVPLVVIELKWWNLSPETLMGYAAKAENHKVFYPHLRYGIVFGGTPQLPAKVFYHELFDYLMAIDCTKENFEIKPEDRSKLIEILNRQRDTAEELQRLQNRKQPKVKVFEDRTHIEYLNRD